MRSSVLQVNLTREIVLTQLEFAQPLSVKGTLQFNVMWAPKLRRVLSDELQRHVRLAKYLVQLPQPEVRRQMKLDRQEDKAELVGTILLAVTLCGFWRECVSLIFSMGRAHFLVHSST